MKLNIQIQGMEQLRKNMKKMNEQMQKKIAASMVAAMARPIKKAAIALAPDSDEPHIIEGVKVYPGNLKKNIISKKRSKKDTKLTAEYVVAVRGKARGLYASRYGSIVEYGSVKMKPRPFMRPAFDQNVTRAITDAAKKGEQRIKEEAGKLKK